MTRDYKHVSETRGGGRRKAKNTQSKGVVSSKKLSSRFILFASLVIAFFISFLIYLVMEVDVDKKGLSEASAVKSSQPMTKKTDVPTTQEPRFTFYEKLMEGEKTPPIIEKNESTDPDVVHDVVSSPSDSRQVQEVKPPSSSRVYVLQVGSFSRFKEADKRKASLAFMGVASRIHAIPKNSGTIYRVKIGPYANIKKINEIESLLKKNNIRSLLMKTKG